jgi:hypothetical protein
MHSTPMCPSAQPDMTGAMVLGVRTGPVETPRISYLAEPVAASEQLLQFAAPRKPAEVFRFAARCEERACSHFSAGACQLAARIVQILPAVVDALPSCQIRRDCRWFRQEGRPASLSCPQVTIYESDPSEEFRTVATPR